MFEPRICYHERARKIYNEGYCGEFKTYTLPARAIKLYGSILNLNEGCNRCHAKLLKEVVREHKRKSSFKPCQLPLLVTMVKVGEHEEMEKWTANDGKEYSCNHIIIDYEPEFDNCLIPKKWLEAHYKDEYPEPTIELSVDGKSLSVNGDYKSGMIRDFIKPYITKTRAGRKSAILAIGEANRVIKEDLPAPVINERRVEKMSQKPNNHKRRQVLDFARDNNLVIHPGGGFEYYINAFYKSGHCPCAKERLDCPCPESIEECKDNGHCKCCLFWRDLDTFKESHVKV